LVAGQPQPMLEINVATRVPTCVSSFIAVKL